MINGQVQPAMAVLLSENDSWADRTFLPDWSIDVRRIPRISFIEVLRGRVSREALAGKRIIVGATAIEMGDRYTTPRLVPCRASSFRHSPRNRCLRTAPCLPWGEFLCCSGPR